LSRTIFKKRNFEMMKDVNNHVAEEGKHMKELLENEP
jgi:hypothetical protein